MGLTLVWIAAIAVIAAAAGGEEPTIEAGSVVTFFALALVAVGGVAGVIGRDRGWVAWFGASVGVTITLAVVLAVTLRGEIGQVIWAPVLGLLAGVIGGVLAAFGWLIGGVGRVLLGKDDTDRGIL